MNQHPEFSDQEIPKRKIPTNWAAYDEPTEYVPLTVRLKFHCGCYVTEGESLIYCSMHTQAPAMLELLQEYSKRMECPDNDVSIGPKHLCYRVRAILRTIEDSQ